ncbi:DUF2931 family protein [Lysobacter arvi]|uniref:DUF2931 family protein n=1 Tax=Lysobacter arvi TaxID=3038776 RepID=A0ABU1CFV5_9GAMM|nr:DUF2931 family protein [Lysobacter arvi]MDR0183829.1 DUF2931 family protein [Lysobacter arvi]
MKRIGWWGALVLLALSSGCTSLTTSRQSRLPYDAWSLGFIAPDHMEVWIEVVEVEDQQGRLFARPGWGLAAVGTQRDPAGWTEPYAFGNSNPITGAVLPERLYVRWQSLVEPQTYRVFIDIDERTRQLMLSDDPPPSNMNFPEGKRFYRRHLVLSLAPGGWVKGWVTGASADPVEVLCVRGGVEPKGPYDGLSGGTYRPVSERAVPYLKTHPIPYDSWKCDPGG